MSEEKKTGLELMREKFPEGQIGKLPKGSNAQMTCDAKEKVNCKVCGGWHHPKLIHLDFVGHAALTDRLLDCDMNWTWEPLAFTDLGIPAFDEDGGLWIKLTVCGMTRLGYGNAAKSQYKEIGSRQKEVIGDALRNAAMRFGAALELWHKGDLHTDHGTVKDQPKKEEKVYVESKLPDFTNEVDKCATVEEVTAWMKANGEDIKAILNQRDRDKLRTHCEGIKGIIEKDKLNINI